MNDILDFFTDMTMVAAVTTASHFGVTIEGADTRQSAGVEAQRSVRRTAVTTSCGKPSARCVRTPAR